MYDGARARAARDGGRALHWSHPALACVLEEMNASPQFTAIFHPSGDMKHIRLACIVLFGLFTSFVICQENQLEDEFESEVDGDRERVQLSKDDFVTSLERVPKSTSSSTAAGNRVRMRRLKFREDKKEETPFYRDGQQYQLFAGTISILVKKARFRNLMFVEKSILHIERTPEHV